MAHIEAASELRTGRPDWYSAVRYHAYPLPRGGGTSLTPVVPLLLLHLSWLNAGVSSSAHSL